jgi:DNA-binding beta-propeller fold protein YncE
VLCIVDGRWRPPGMYHPRSIAVVVLLVLCLARVPVNTATAAPLRGVVRDSVAVGGQPWRSFAMADGRTLAVLNAKGWVSFVDIDSRSVSGRTSTFSDGLFEAEITPDGSTLVAWSSVGARLHFVDLRSRQHDGHMRIGANLGHGHLLHDGRRLLLSAVASQTVSLVDVAERRVLSTLRFPRAIGNIVLNSSESLGVATGGVYRLGGGSTPIGTQVFLFDVGTVGEGDIREARALDAGRHPRSAAFLQSWVVVANRGAGTVTVVDPASARVVDSLQVGRRPELIVPAPDRRTAVVVNEGTDYLSVLDATAATPPRLARTIALPGKPNSATFLDQRWLLVTVAGRRIVTRVHHMAGQSLWGSFALQQGEKAGAGQRRDLVVVVDYATGEAVKLVPTAPGPVSIWSEPSGSSIAVACATGGRLDFVE